MKIFFFLLFVILLAACQQQPTTPSVTETPSLTMPQPYKTQPVNRENLFFKGVLNPSNGEFHFNDCTTGQTTSLQLEQSIASRFSSRLFLLFRGAVLADGTIQLNKLIGTTNQYRCVEPLLTGAYYSIDNKRLGYTLQLHPDYTFQLDDGVVPKLSGHWGKPFQDQGVLFTDPTQQEGVLFTINYLVNKVIITLSLTSDTYLIFSTLY